METKKYALCFDSKKNFNAGSKATEDINVALKKRDYDFIYIPLFNTKVKLFDKIANLAKYCVLLRIKKKSLVFVQHPQYIRGIYMDILVKLKKLKGCKFVFLIHDIESLRKAFPENNEQFQALDRKMYNLSDVIIAHNESMIGYLTEKCHVSKDKIVNLQLFDYLVSDINGKSTYEEETIVVAGNLTEKKAGYIYELANVVSALKIKAYGANFNEGLNKNNKIIYEGAFKPEELPVKMSGSWGLVWDGASVKSCEGNMGNYMRYNNPHKVSLYIASELPIIIWKEAALAEFVKKNNIGIVVDSLTEVETMLKNVTCEEYLTKKKNIAIIAERIKQGEFANVAISLAEKKIEEF